MPSKKSKPRPKQASLWKVAPNCSESETLKLAHVLAAELKPGDRVLLEGPMGAGKSTFARALLQGLGVERQFEGSPTFAIAHEYPSSRGIVVHIDFYRLRSEAEIEEAGIPDYFWGSERITLAEWTSLWPEFERAVLETGQVWRVNLEFAEERDRRKLAIHKG